MSTPTMKGFTQIVPYEYVEILDTLDSRAFNMKVVEPGGDTANTSAWWMNMGYSYLCNGQLSLVAGGTLDTGPDVDSIDAMKLCTNVGGEILQYGIAATATNTAGWTNPMSDPMRPFLDSFRCGIKWYCPALAGAPQIIRKCFQWDGSYYPDTWDYIWYPMGNGHLIDNGFYSNPMTQSLSGMSGEVSVDGTSESGYALVYNVDNPTSPATLSVKHYQAGDPWYDSVDSATGWVVSFRFMWIANVTGTLELNTKDGAYDYSLYIDKGGISDAGGSYLYSTLSAYSTIEIKVIGTAYNVCVDGASRLSGVLSSATATKVIEFIYPYGAASASYTGELIRTSHIKYFLNGNTPPVY